LLFKIKEFFKNIEKINRSKQKKVEKNDFMLLNNDKIEKIENEKKI